METIRGHSTGGCGRRFRGRQDSRTFDHQDGDWSAGAGIDGQGNVWGITATELVWWSPSGQRTVVPGRMWPWIEPYAVNPSGRVVGYATNEDCLTVTPWQATKPGYVPLENLPGAACFPQDLNGAGVIVGNCETNDGHQQIAVGVGNTVFEAVFDLPEQPDLGPWVMAISARGRITGRYRMRVAPSQGLPYFISTGVIATPKAALRVAER